MNVTSRELSNSALNSNITDGTTSMQLLYEFLVIILIIIIFGIFLWGYIYVCTHPNTVSMGSNQLWVRIRDICACYKPFPSSSTSEINLLPIPTCTCVPNDRHHCLDNQEEHNAIMEHTGNLS